MITKVYIENFKNIHQLDLDIHPTIQLIVGQNNSGKTTVMQAINLWAFLAQVWKRERRGDAKLRTGVAVARNQIYPTPVRSAKHLWRNNEVRVKGKTSENILLIIKLEGINENGEVWKYGMQLRYGNDQLVYCNPVDSDVPIPSQAEKVFHLPALSGIKTNENKLDPAAQSLAIGEGRPGDVLRNVLYELYSTDRDGWKELKVSLKELFSITLQDISYNPAVDPEIVIEYKTPDNTTLEIASAGSGLLQFLQLAAFVTLHRNSTLLVDEPDSHLHASMKRHAIDWLEEVGEKNGNQFIIATHSSAVVERSRIKSIQVLPQSNKMPNFTPKDVSQLLRLSNNDVIRSVERKFVLWTEDFTDQRDLQAFAKKLEHKSEKLIADAFWKPLRGNDIRQAREMHQTVRATTNSEFVTLVLRDRMHPTENLPDGMTCRYWEEVEIENYLIYPEAICGYIRHHHLLGGMFAENDAQKAMDWLKGELPPNYCAHPRNSTLGNNKGSELLDKLFAHLNWHNSKPDYYKIIEFIPKDQIKDEVAEVLEWICNGS